MTTHATRTVFKILAGAAATALVLVASAQVSAAEPPSSAVPAAQWTGSEAVQVTPVQSRGSPRFDRRFDRRVDPYFGYYRFGYRGHPYWRGYSYGFGQDPFHFYSPPWRFHRGPHSGLHFGPHYHPHHGYHWGWHAHPHWDWHGFQGHTW